MFKKSNIDDDVPAEEAVDKYSPVSEVPPDLTEGDIHEIIMRTTGFKGEKVDDLVNEKIKESGGQLTKIGAMLMVANENEVPLEIPSDGKKWKKSKVSEEKFEDVADTMFQKPDDLPEDAMDDAKEDDVWGA